MCDLSDLEKGWANLFQKSHFWNPKIKWRKLSYISASSSTKKVNPFWKEGWSISNITRILCFFEGIYSAISVSEAIVMLTRDIFFYTRCAIAAKYIHEALLDGVMKSPMVFFDTNPLGRIINRFSADVDSLGTFIWNCPYQYN